MMASTCTWARRISSLSITAISDFMIFGGAVMISALVATSAQMVTLASTLAVPPPPAAAPAAGGPPCALAVAVAWPLSLSAIFSASA